MVRYGRVIGSRGTTQRLWRGSLIRPTELLLCHQITHHNGKTRVRQSGTDLPEVQLVLYLHPLVLRRREGNAICLQLLRCAPVHLHSLPGTSG